MQEVMTALITPFKPDQSIDFEALEELINEQINDGIDGFIVCGTTAETPTLTPEERIAVLDFVIAKTKKQAAIWYGCGSNDTKACIKACKEIEDRDINGVLLVTPYYNRPSQQGIYEHFYCIAHTIEQQIMLYNIPSRTGCEITGDTIMKLLETCDHIVALKHAHHDLSFIQQLHRQYPDFAIYSGEDALFEEGFALGMCGLISVMSHVALKPLKQYLRHPDKTLKAALDECAKMCFMDASPAPIKYMMARAHRCEPVLRLPMVGVSQENAFLIDRFLTEYDSILHMDLI